MGTVTIRMVIILDVAMTDYGSINIGDCSNISCGNVFTVAHCIKLHSVGVKKKPIL